MREATENKRERKKKEEDIIRVRVIIFIVGSGGYLEI